MNTHFKEQFDSLDPGVRIVVIHPNFAQQHIALKYVLSSENAAYLRLTGQALTADDLDGQLKAAGIKLKSGMTLVLDECDRAAQDAIGPYLKDAVLTQIKQGRVILLGRDVPVGLLDEPKLRAQMAFVPVDPDSMLVDYTKARATGVHLLEVWGFGSGRVLIDGRPITNWDGVLPRALFFYFVDRGMTTRSEIFDAFWPNMQVREATNVFHVTKRKISEVLGIDLTLFSSGFYHLAPNLELYYDVRLFNNLVQDSEVAEADEAMTMLRKALGLYRGSFVSGLDSPWAKLRREQTAQAFGDALVAQARLLEAQDNNGEALVLYSRAANLQPPRDDAMERVFELAQALDRHNDALTIYHNFERYLREHLKIAPVVPLQQLAERAAAAIK
ncbi:MAG: bacterial transcriptional activator domain-containing protein [Anaerolineae bacterium]|nr:bacterial transcriptional activator domain-containing protein [Anaerolineae bacterium]MCA9908604.1 bacterial transcriptional activator domain-containing protein [Anaerolineae bacterium]